MDVGFEVWLAFTLTSDVNVWFEVWFRGGAENEAVVGIIPGVVVVELGAGAERGVNVEPAVAKWLEGGSCVCLEVVESAMPSDTTPVGAMIVVPAVV